MDARAIFNSIKPESTYELLKAYNDTVDPRRTWTLCGRLDEDQKYRLRWYIRMSREWTLYYILLFALMDGDEDAEPPTDDDGKVYHCAFMILSCYNAPLVHVTPWIHHNNPRFMSSIQVVSAPSPIPTRQIADYIVLTDYVDRDDYIGTPILPAVAEIIIAEKILGKTTKTIEWLVEPGHEGVYYRGKMRCGERWIMGCHQVVSGYKSEEIFDKLACGTKRDINSVPLHDVCIGFCSVNRLISVVDIWRVFGVSLLRCVNASAGKIIAEIIKSRIHNGGIAIFDECPSQDYADVSIITGE